MFSPLKLLLPLLAGSFVYGGIPTIDTSEADELSIRVPAPRYRLRADEIDVVAACLVLEAASQGEAGMRGVMCVIRNRAHGEPALLAVVVLKPRQFSAFNKVMSRTEVLGAAIARARRDRMWSVALRLVLEAAGTDWSDVTGGATHYTKVGESNGWINSLRRTVTIGDHAFYR